MQTQGFNKTREPGLWGEMEIRGTNDQAHRCIAVLFIIYMSPIYHLYVTYLSFICHLYHTAMCHVTTPLQQVI